jgi:hypothetical protein
MARPHQPDEAVFKAILPEDTWHFHWAKSGEYVTQVSAIGPLGIEYHDADDDPRGRDHVHAASESG